MATRHSPDFWQTHLAAWRASALSVSSYCTYHRLSTKTFYRWRSQLTAVNHTPQASPSLTLVPVSIQTPSASTTSTIHLHSPAGWQVTLPLGNTPWLIDLLRQLP